VDDSWLDSGQKQKLLHPVKELFKFTGASKNSEFFTVVGYTNFLRFPKFSKKLELQEYDLNSDLYVLFCFWQILFSMHSLLVLWFLWLMLLNINCRNDRVQYESSEKNYESFLDSTKVNDLFYHTNPSHEVPLSFVWLKFSSFGWDIDMRRIKSDKTLRLGMTKARQGNIRGRSKQLSLGMPRKASPLSSPTLSVTLLGAIFLFVTWYVFCLEHHFLLLGFAFCYL
jgi:hypothetical protein